MTLAGLVLVALAGIGMPVFGLPILIRAFKTRLAWGRAILLVPCRLRRRAGRAMKVS